MATKKKYDETKDAGECRCPVTWARPASYVCAAQKSSEDVAALAILESVEYALKGEAVSDFMESFPVVRQVLDLKADLAHLEATCTRLRDERDQLRDASLKVVRLSRAKYGGHILNDAIDALAAVTIP